MRTKRKPPLRSMFGTAHSFLGVINVTQIPVAPALPVLLGIEHRRRRKVLVAPLAEYRDGLSRRHFDVLSWSRERKPGSQRIACSVWCSPKYPASTAISQLRYSGSAPCQVPSRPVIQSSHSHTSVAPPVPTSARKRVYFVLTLPRRNTG